MWFLTYSGHWIVPEGEAIINIKGQPIKSQVVCNGHPILEKQAHVQLKMIVRINDLTKQGPTSGCLSTRSEALLSQYHDVFNGLGLIKTNATIHTDPKVIPVVDPPRCIPYAIYNQVYNEIQIMFKFGVITEQKEPTKWVNSITTVCKPNKIRVCLDPTKLNEAV